MPGFVPFAALRVTFRSKVAITIGVRQDDLRRFFDSVVTAATASHAWTVEEERSLTVLVGTRPRTTLQQLWPSLARRN